ncbi:Alpha-tubulin N-acetyltransferase 1 [Mortierella polycephala]|uniref:Alpha-tubulin N-acetyltransferase n=1 Tax=Mortierella polycephala TaxID=41804 RepID=A0A9P6QC17_9FUNG|nr:Alpha-tubulin N-acetyltransferase 1 [Mortierella polycephala]
MDFDFPLIPLLPLPITLVPAATFAALESSQNQTPLAFASSVSIGLSNSTSSSFSSSSLSSYPTHNGGASAFSDQERLGAIVDALGEASAKAQELPTSITQRLRLAKNPTQRVYILRTGLDNGEDQWLDQLEIGSSLMRESIRKSLMDLNGDSCSNVEDWTATSAQENASKRSTKNRSEEKGVYVAGMLKIGEKKLFIVDKSGALHEQEVCCVLDFYVDESFQRRGFGKLLFDYMIKVEGIDPNQIAYDRPSPKLYRFLNKHFQLHRHLPQPNQFAIFEGFKLLDCGKTIQVVDDSFPTGGRAVSSVNQPLQRQDITSIPSQSSGDSNGGVNICAANKAPTISRALQSSVVFGPGITKDPSSTAIVADNQNYTQAQATHQQQQPNRRISSAFTSSIKLSSPDFTNGGPSSAAATTTASSPALQHHSNGSLSGGSGIRISRLLASSIVFADPAVSYGDS